MYILGHCLAGSALYHRKLEETPFPMLVDSFMSYNLLSREVDSHVPSQ